MDATYRVQEVAERLGISIHTLHYYERIGLLPAVTRDVAGHRRYDEDAVGWVRILMLLRATGMPIAQMQRFAALVHGGPHTVPERLAVLEEHERDILMHLEVWERHLQSLRAKIAVYRDVVAGRRTLD